MKIIITILTLTVYTSLLKGQLITGTYSFMSDPAKKYALYVPSDYDSQIPSKVIVGLHPWNTSRWNAETWARELSEIADSSNCIVICPDGGADGQIDDAIDTAFTTYLINEVDMMYNIDRSKMYLVGFSWGGRTVYTYGLNNKSTFAGFMPIGAAIESSVVNSLTSAMDNTNFYIIHGSNDDPNSSFYPLINLLKNNGACVESNLLNGVGHTIDFPNQFNVLNDGLVHLINTSCQPSSTTSDFQSTISVFPNPCATGQMLNVKGATDANWTIMDFYGRTISYGKGKEIQAPFESGIYFVKLQNHGVQKVVVID